MFRPAQESDGVSLPTQSKSGSKDEAIANSEPNKGLLPDGTEYELAIGFPTRRTEAAKRVPSMQTAGTREGRVRLRAGVAFIAGVWTSRVDDPRHEFIH
ncbi:MAG: hypothetical protein AAFX06_10220 [Planctomycetota bacterium]